MRAAARRAHDRRPLGSRFQDTCHQTREGGGLPEGSIIPPGITHDLVLQFDLPARRMERKERLLAMHGGDVNATLYDICEEGGGKDARFLLARGADANHRWGGGPVLQCAARNGNLSVVEALLDAGADGLGGEAMWQATFRGNNTAVVALLLDCGADVHFGNDLALWNVAYFGHLETATLLLQRGATPRNEFLAIAVQRGHHAVVDLLRAHGVQ